MTLASALTLTSGYTRSKRSLTPSGTWAPSISSTDLVLPLQFVYKLKVQDGDCDKCAYKARLVMRGNLQYEHEYGDTYAPTARMWAIRTLAAIAAQERMTLKKFDLPFESGGEVRRMTGVNWDEQE